MAIINIRRGDAPAVPITIFDEAGDPYDLTACTVWFTAKRNREDDDEDAVLSYKWTDGGASNGLSVADPSTGEVVISFAALDTAELTNLGYIFDVQVLAGDGKPYTVVDGILSVSLDVTRTTTP